MRAMVLRAFGGPLELMELADPPSPGPGQVVVRVRACGVCYTDLKILHGRLPSAILPSLPHILGHEPAGEVVAVGEGVSGVAPGDRVAVYFYLPCGRCRFCRTGEETLCERVRQFGFNLPGGMAQYMVVPDTHVARLADHVPFEQGAIIADAVATPVHGLRNRAGLRMGETVLVVGSGGLGLHAIQAARLGGARVLAVDRVPEKLELARQAGADEVFLTSRPHLEQALREASGGGVDLAVDFVGRPESLRLAVGALRRGGRLLMVGYLPDTELAVPTGEVVLRQLTILGVRAAPLQSFRETVQLVNEGRLRPMVTDRFDLEQANEALRRLEQGSLLGRAVLHVG